MGGSGGTLRAIGLPFKGYSKLIITDYINRILQVLKEDLYWIRISAQDTRLMELVEP